MSQELVLPNKEQVATAIGAMRKTLVGFGYKRWPSDYYLEVMFWAAFFANHLNQTK